MIAYRCWEEIVSDGSGDRGEGYAARVFSFGVSLRMIVLNFFFLNVVLGFRVQLFLILFFKYCVDVENCGSLKSFGYIYIYRLVEGLCVARFL